MNPNRLGLIKAPSYNLYRILRIKKLYKLNGEISSNQEELFQKTILFYKREKERKFNQLPVFYMYCVVSVVKSIIVNLRY